MDPAHVVLLIATAVAVLAIAGYLIAIALILRHVVNRLVGILQAVQAVTDTAEPVGAIIDDINHDLGAGRKLLEDAVRRLEQRTAPADATAAGSASREAQSGGGTTATLAPPSASEDRHADPPAKPPARGRDWFKRQT